MVQDKQALLRQIPSVDRLLSDPRLSDVSREYPRDLILKAVHQELDEIRTGILNEALVPDSALKPASVLDRIVDRVHKLGKPSLRPVINATGVVVHTNLGRSLLAENVLQDMGLIAAGYSNLEYDLAMGKRGSRYSHVEEILKDLTGAEAAMVVNNNAGAVLIALETMAKGREIIVSRGQLVEIGGSFRVPDVMRKSGARMVEVGTTNKTHLKDYEGRIGPETGLLLKVHTSNFKIMGFTREVHLTELAALGRQHGIPVMEDLGSGCLIDFSKFGMIKEPTVQEVLAQGADLVTFSGDKLLGGPQAGIILGRKDLVEGIKQNPLNRALRIDKLTLAALEGTLRLYQDQRVALKEIPTLRMLCEPYDDLVKKARRLMSRIGKLDTLNFSVEMSDGVSRVGGGALPLLALQTRLVTLVPERMSAPSMEAWLRGFAPPIITRVEKERVLMDVRTIQDAQFKTVGEAVKDMARMRISPSG